MVCARIGLNLDSVAVDKRRQDGPCFAFEPRIKHRGKAEAGFERRNQAGLRSRDSTIFAVSQAPRLAGFLLSCYGNAFRSGKEHLRIDILLTLDERALRPG